MTGLHDSYNSWHLYICRFLFFCVASLLFRKGTSFLVFSDKDDKLEVPSHNSLNVDNSVGRQRTHTLYSYKSRAIPVLWLSFVCKWLVGEVGHLWTGHWSPLVPFPSGHQILSSKINKQTNKDIKGFIQRIEPSFVRQKRKWKSIVR